MAINKRGNEMTTLKDIANAAGCSIRTVSRVINKSKDVNETTREKILKIIDQYNYKPNPFAQSLKTNKKNSIALLLGSIDSDVIRFRVETLSRLFNSAGYSLLIQHSVNLKRMQEIVDDLNRRCDALIIFSSVTDEFQNLLIYLQKIGLPFILVDPDIETHYPSVYIDRVSGYQDATSYLLDKGKKQLYLVLEQKRYKSADRIKGFSQGLKKYNIEFKEEQVVYSSKGFRAGYDQGPLVLELINKNIVDGVLCENDKVALGLISYLQKKGIEIPRQISIIGFDNDHYTEYCNPAISTISQSGQSLATYIYEQIVNHLENKLEMKSTVFKTSFIVRESS